MSTDILIKAGAQAFGDGSHPTTAGVLAALEAIDPAAFSPRIACDMGCGSGILAFSIIRLLRCPVVAVDSMAEAIETLRHNAAHNGIGTIAYSQGTPITQPAIMPVHAEGFDHPAITAAAPFDLITMNILAEPLLALAAAAERHLAPGGVMILSGILQWQEAQIHAAYQGLGLELASRLTVGDWRTLLWQKPE